MFRNRLTTLLLLALCSVLLYVFDGKQWCLC